MNNIYNHKKLAWDFDGTLFDTWNIHCEAIREVHKTIFHNNISMVKLIRAQKACLTDTIKTIFTESYDEAFNLYKKNFKNYVSENKLKDTINIYDYLRELCDQGYEMCLITGRDSETTNFILRYFSIYSFFKEIYTVDVEGNTKEKILKKNVDKWLTYEYITDSPKEMCDFANIFSEIHLVNWFK